MARQVRMLQATNPEGIPLHVRPHPGNAAELSCIGMALERLAALLGPGVLICADSALGNFKNLCAAHRAGLRFVVPLRASTEARERALSKAEGELAKVRGGLGGRYYKTLQQVEARVSTILSEPVCGLLVVRTGVRQGKPSLRWRRNRVAIAAAARTDGIYALATNLRGPLTPTRALPTGRSIFAAFQGLGLTYTDDGPRLDPLTATQRRILQLLNARIPWTERDSLPSPICGKRG